ncbi:hypothetical protein RR48_00376 [Papilio machaon]|uniref:Uncharacterized protein n=1 Tax=Papilio machaon TaxID=76193 RepID=A0A0N0PFT1_PAPMA|nr:hypothetical protein RR48_00376 [Papilio machaon]
MTLNFLVLGMTLNFLVLGMTLNFLVLGMTLNFLVLGMTLNFLVLGMTIILWRKSNKLALRLQVRCGEEVEAGSAAEAALTLQYRYRNTVPAPHEPRDHTLHATLMLQLGHVSG